MELNEPGFFFSPRIIATFSTYSLEGFNEAREWLGQTSTREELERLWAESRAKHKAA